jgi:hypothetical protein
MRDLSKLMIGYHEPEQRRRNGSEEPPFVMDENAWPEPLSEAAYHGLPGELVRLYEPHSEADPAALLLQSLTAFGNACGRGAYYLAQDHRHHPNLFLVIVGGTSASRKGTSLRQAKRVIELADEPWRTGCQAGGVSSGEGLIERVRDATIKEEETDEGEITEKIVDAGITDKRLLVVEPEFSSVLRVCRRDGQITSEVLRRAWDGDTLEVLRRNAVRATEAHISLIAHITPEELKRELSDTTAANGFGNRFLYTCVKRSRYLPRAQGVLEHWLLGYQTKVTERLRLASMRGRVDFDREAGELFDQEYRRLVDRPAGLLGAITGRAEAQVVRLALVYALFDGAEEIALPHLRAALAVWDYAEQSARHLFGRALGDPTADDLLAALKRAGSEGLTRNQMRDLFTRNKSRAEINRALALLLGQGLVRFATEETGGRPAERWWAA